VQVDVAVAHLHVHAEGDGVDPQVAMGHLDALGPGRRPAGVVDRRGGLLVGLRPGAGLGVEAEQLLVLLPRAEPVLGHDALERRLELGIDEQHPRTGVADDVGDLLR
jgi:hypothetical protein